MDDRWTSTGRKTGHPGISAALIVVGSLLATVLILSVWANRQVFDTEGWVSTGDRVLQDPEVQDELSRYISDELFSNVAIQGELKNELPPSLRNLADTSAAGLRRQAPAEVKRELNTPRFERIFSASNRAAHETLMRLLDDRSRDPAGDRGVVLDLSPVVTAMSTELGFSEEVTAQVPSDVARLTVLEPGQVSTARKLTRVVQSSPLVLGLLVVVLFALAVLTAGSRRVFAIGLAGAGLVAAGLLALLIRSLAEPAAVDWLAATPSVRPAADAIWGIGTSGIPTYAVWSMIGGALVIVGAVIAGMWPDRSGPDRFRHEYDHEF